MKTLLHYNVLNLYVLAYASDILLPFLISRVKMMIMLTLLKLVLENTLSAHARKTILTNQLYNQCKKGLRTFSCIN